VSPRSEELITVARIRLSEARAASQSGLDSSAVNAAYYAMLYAARAALSEEDVHAKTHRGTWALFRETFVARDRFDSRLLARASEAQRIREAADYDAKLPAHEDTETIVELAEQFVHAVEVMLG
jgi:uncharacterized protein (UPF0332 family)